MPRLSVEGVAKSYGPTKALRRCSFSVWPGEVHGLVGENGSGKSTLVKLLSGVLTPDTGVLAIDGTSVRLRTPSEAQAQGVSTVFQETLIVDELSVADNILLGLDGLIQKRLRGSAGAVAVSAALQAVGLAGMEPDREAWRLSLGERQLLAVARAMVRPWSLLVLDESTSALDVKDRDHLFAVLRERVASGSSVLMITHRSEELARFSDRVTILRSGESVETLETENASSEVIVSLVAGERASTSRDRPTPTGPVPKPAAADAPSAAFTKAIRSTRLQVTGLRLRPHSDPISMSAVSGEIVGIAGLEGHGQTDFVESISGVSRSPEGQILIANGEKEGCVRDLASAASLGVAYVVRDRKREGIFADRSVSENLTISALSRVSVAGLLKIREMRLMVNGLASRLDVRMRSPRAPIRELSGGNQQKVLLGRALSLSPRVLVMNDSLRGVDHQAKLDTYRLLRELADEGLVVVFLSTEVDELVALADRILVFRAGSIGSTLRHATSREVVSAMFGETHESAAP